MNPSLSYSLLLVFIITTQSLICSTAIDTEDIVIVKDSTGKKALKNNVPYHIGPVIPKNGGRIKLTDTINNKKVCPLDVVQQNPSAGSNSGGQFTFTMIALFKDKYLYTGSVVFIESGPPSPTDECQESTYWTINDVTEPPPSNLITTGGSFQTAFTCFQVAEYPKPTDPNVPSYMLQYCPVYCGAAPPDIPICSNVSIYLDNGVRRLGVTGGTPFEFAFYKVKATHDNM